MVFYRHIYCYQYNKFTVVLLPGQFKLKINMCRVQQNWLAG